MSQRIYVLAKDYEEARSYANKKGFHYSSTINVDRNEKLMGMRGVELHVTKNAHVRKNYMELVNMAKTCEVIFLFE